MDGMARADLQGVVAPLNFLEPMAEKPYSYNYDPPPGQPARNGHLIEHKVTVRDARPVNDALSLDREGFVLLRHQTAAADLSTGCGFLVVLRGASTNDQAKIWDCRADADKIAPLCSIRHRA